MNTTCEQTLSDALLAQSSWLRVLVRTLVHDAAQVDDVCQATLLEALRRRPGHDRSLRPWLASVARHICSRLSKRERQRVEREAAVTPRESAPPTVEVVERVAWHQAVVNAVMALAEPYRTTILLRFWEDARPAEVSRRMGVPVETVRTRIKRGVAMLRERLDRDCGSRQWFTGLLPLALGEGNISTITLALVMTKKVILIAAAALTAITLTCLSWPEDTVPAVAVAAQDDNATQQLGTSEPRRSEEASDRIELGGGTAVSTEGEEKPPLDPAIAAALCGFRGRVVDADGDPVRGCEVSIYRVAAETLFGGAADFLRATGRGPDLVRRHDHTNDDGEFFVSGVWPRGAFLLLGGDDSKGRVLSLVDRSPRPGEVVDLGDVALARAGVVRGRVVDSDGEPVVGARVRAFDLPGVWFAALPLERFDEDGALFNRDESVSFSVVPVPAWLRSVYERLPIPDTTTVADGSFALESVPLGSNVVAITKEGFLSVVDPRVVVRSERDKDLGRIRLREGEELAGKVVDDEGKPVPGVEVLAAPTSAVVPVDFASRLDATDAQGRFVGHGFPPGRATVAVRRGPGHPWTLSEPQSLSREVVVRLPSVHELTFSVTSKSRRKIAELEVEILAGKLDESTVVMRRMGAIAPIDLARRMQRRSESEWCVTGLPSGPYVVAVSCEGHARVVRPIRVEGDHELRIELEPALRYEVRVTTRDGVPVRQASVYARPAQRDITAISHVHCGNTDAAGRLDITTIQATKILVAVSHPAYGMVDAMAEHGRGELHVVLKAPGSVAGKVIEQGRTPAPGRWSIVLWGRPTLGENILRDSPRFAAVTSRGEFEFGSLQPGAYEMRAIRSLNLVRSMKAAFDLIEKIDKFDSTITTVVVTAGQPTEATVRIGAAENVTESGSRLRGTVTIDGRPGANVRLRLRNRNGDAQGKTTADAGGRFDFGNVTAGIRLLAVYPKAGAKNENALYRETRRLLPAGEEVIEIQFETTRLSGLVVGTDGQPIANARIHAARKPPGAILHSDARSDARGRFELEQMIGGTYLIRARLAGSPVRFAPIQEVVIRAGQQAKEVRFVLRPALRVRGRIDIAKLSLTEANNIRLEFLREIALSKNVRTLMHGPKADVRPDGTFDAGGFASGLYRVKLTSDKGHDLEHDGKVRIGAVDVDGLELKLVQAR